MGPNRTLHLRAEPLPTHGDLASTPFAVLLGWARAMRSTGILSVAGEKFVFLQRGTPVHVDSVLDEETSEVYLKGRVPPVADERQLEAARAAARDSGRGVGEALLGLGFMDPSELYEHKRAHTRLKLVSCFSLSAGPVRFEPRDSFGSELVPLPMDVGEALREGVGRYYDRARLDRELPLDDLGRVGSVEGAAAPNLATEEARLLQMAARRPTVQALATAMGLRADQIRRHLYVLYCLGLVAFELGGPIAEESEAERRMPHPFPVPRAGTASTGRSARPSGPAAPETVGPTPASTPRPAVAPPPAQATTPLVPSTPAITPHPPSPPTPPPIGLAPSRPAFPTPGAMPVVTPRPLTAAPTSARREPTGAIPTRRDKPAGASSESIDAAIEAAEIARAGDDLLGALEVLRAADGTFPNEPKLQAQLALTMVLVDERKHAKEANRLAHDARRAAPSLPIPYVVMGILLEQIHQKDQAAQMYRHALARDPDCIEATRRMALLEGVKATK